MFKNFHFLALGIFLFSCSGEVSPKPYGELRLEYPEAKYLDFQTPCGYGFQYSDFARVEKSPKGECWYYVNYPKMKAKIFLTYFPIKNDLNLHIKEAERMVYEHTVKASAIETKAFEYAEKKVFGNFYELKGQTASNIQFYATDSTRHFVTANLYFSTRPRPDSLAPAIDYIKKDVIRMLDTFSWTK